MKTGLKAGTWLVLWSLLFLSFVSPGWAHEGDEIRAVVEASFSGVPSAAAEESELQPVTAASECEALVLTTIEANRNYWTRWQRWGVQVLKPRILSRVRKECYPDGVLTCSDEKLRQTIVGEVARASVFLPRVRGYVGIVALMILTSAVTTTMNAKLPKQWAFLSNFVGQLTTFGIFVLGAPVWEILSAASRRFAFGMIQQQTPVYADDHGSQLSEFSAQWGRTQQLYDLNAQMARNLLTQYLSWAGQLLEQGFHSLDLGSEAVAGKLALLAVLTRWNFQDIQPQNDSIVATVRSCLIDPYKARGLDLRALSIETRRQILVLESGRSRSGQSPSTPESRERLEKYYDQLLHAWIGVDGA